MVLKSPSIDGLQVFVLRKIIYLMVKCLVSCKLVSKPIHTKLQRLLDTCLPHSSPVGFGVCCCVACVLTIANKYVNPTVITQMININQRPTWAKNWSRAKPALIASVCIAKRPSGLSTPRAWGELREVLPVLQLNVFYQWNNARYIKKY